MSLPVTISSLDNQLISRTLDIVQGEYSTVFRISRSHVLWRLVVAETSGTCGLFVRIRYTGADNEYHQSYNVNPNGAEELTGNGSCTIEILGVGGSGVARCELTDPLSFQGVYSTSQGYQTVTTWSAVGTNNGYAPDFMNYLVLWVSGSFDFRCVDINGTVVSTYTNLNPNDFLSNGTLIPLSKRMKYEIQSTGGVGSVVYRPTYFNRR